MVQKLDVSIEGKTTTLEASSDEEMKTKVMGLAKDAGLARFVVKTEDGRKLAPNELGQVGKVRVMRTEVAGL